MSNMLCETCAIESFIPCLWAHELEPVEGWTVKAGDIVFCPNHKLDHRHLVLKRCKACGANFEVSDKNKTYCSDACRAVGNRIRGRNNYKRRLCPVCMQAFKGANKLCPECREKGKAN